MNPLRFIPLKKVVCFSYPWRESPFSSQSCIPYTIPDPFVYSPSSFDEGRCFSYSDSMGCHGRGRTGHIPSRHSLCRHPGTGAVVDAQGGLVPEMAVGLAQPVCKSRL